MKTTITGASGFIGYHLARRLAFNDAYITVRGGENDPFGKHVSYDDMPPTDLLIHLAAITDTTITDEHEMMWHNCYHPLYLFRKAIDQGCKTIIYASSCAVYGSQATLFHEDLPCKPLNVYGKSKAMLEEYAMKMSNKYGVTMIGLRFSNVYGPKEEHKGKSASMVSQIGWQMRKGNPRLFRDGEQKRDWLFVDDCVNGILCVANREPTCHKCKTKWKSGVYNIASGISTSFNNLVCYWNKALGTTREIEYIDNPYESAYQSLTEVDIRKANRELGYYPIKTVEAGIKILAKLHT